MSHSPRRLAVPAFLVLAFGALALFAREEAFPADPNIDARIKIARENYERLLEMTLEQFNAPPADAAPGQHFLDEQRAERFSNWSRRWMEAERDRAETKEARIAAIEAHLDRMRSLESKPPLDADRFRELDKGEPEGFRSTSRDFFDAVAFFRLEAESWLAKARAE